MHELAHEPMYPGVPIIWIKDDKRLNGVAGCLQITWGEGMAKGYKARTRVSAEEHVYPPCIPKPEAYSELDIPTKPYREFYSRVAQQRLCPRKAVFPPSVLSKDISVLASTGLLQSKFQVRAVVALMAAQLKPQHLKYSPHISN